MAGQPRLVRFHIVDQVNIIGIPQIRNEDWRLVTISQTAHDADSAMEWLAQRHLLKNTMECTNCNILCSLQTYNQGVDGKRWACPGCAFRKSIREGSFFTRSHLPLTQIIMLMYCFAWDFPQILVKHEMGIQQDNTVLDWYNFCREDIGVFLERHATEIGGFDDNGEPSIVEIDESYYFHRKYHRGAWREGHWVFGGVERATGKCFLVEVPDRTAATLEALILQHILPGSHIISDGWPAYVNIDQLGNGIYMHSVIVHQHNFVDPIDQDIHTQNIENLWMRAKRKLKRQSGTSRALFTSYLHEFQFRSSVEGNNVFGEFLLVIAEQYPCD